MKKGLIIFLSVLATLAVIALAAFVLINNSKSASKTPADGPHTHTPGEWIVDTYPTETVEGSKHQVCAICGETIATDSIPATGHTHSWGTWIAETPATDEQNGVKGHYHCPVCGKDFDMDGNEISNIVIPATGHTHTPGEWIIDTQPTETAPGSKHQVCATCGATIATNSIPATGHTHSWGAPVEENRTEADCTKAGKYDSVIYCAVCGEELERTATTISATGHTEVTDSAVPATCTQTGLTEGKHCSACGAVIVAQQVTEALGHLWNSGVVTTQPTATATGVKTYTCQRCGATKTETVPATGGNLYTREGDYIYFGSYPQSEVTDSALKTTLNSKAGTLPTAGNAKKWTSYGYYIESSVQDYMWYIDVTEGGESYRGVYFTSYRPYYTTYSSSAGNSYQDNNGYITGNVYWFRFEPLKWRILSESNGKALILCESMIDSQQYYHNKNTRTINNQTVYPNNYEYSDIRAWLNEIFYETAFTDLQKALIETTTVDNSAKSTNPYGQPNYWNSGNNQYACSNTQDKVFLLSEEEVTNSAYGFNTAPGNDDTVRRKQTTAYARAQGAYTNTSADYAGNGWWWLRSPDDGDDYGARVVRSNGYAGSIINYVYRTDYGAVPALQIRLSGMEPETEDPLYTQEGDYIYFGSYPQSEVTDSTLKSTLNSKAGTLPTADNAQAWTSYGYYIEGSVQDYMWYVDVTEGGETYRGVYFTQYRPYFITTNSSSADNSVQDDNGYTTGNVYWFQFEPLKWRILSESNGKALILCESIIDSQQYYHNENTRTINNQTVYPNNYEYSDIRAWLNEVFYETAFNDLQKALIETTTVDNSARSTNTQNNATQWSSGNNQYACNNTQDKVFLLSEEEVTNSTYGFSTNPDNYDTVRRKQPTAYARAQGAYTNTSAEYAGNGWWWLRSPYYYFANFARVVDDYGYAGSYYVSNTRSGAVPALQIRRQ